MGNFQLKDGIHFSPESAQISYPSNANDNYFNIEEKSFWFEHRNFIIAEIFKRYVPRSHRFVDLGGGNGFVASKVMSLGYDVTLVEAGSGVYNARKRGIKDIYCINILDFKLAEKPVCIGLFDVVEHFKEPNVLYKNISLNIPNASMMVLTVPAYKCLWSDEDDIAGHFARYTKLGIERELQRNEYEIIYSSYFFSLLIFPILFFRSLPYRLRKCIGVKKEPSANISGHVGLGQKIMIKLLQWERKVVAEGYRIPFGGSIIVIAVKKTVLTNNKI